MDELTKRVLADVLGLLGVGGILGFLLRRWIAEAFRKHYTVAALRDQATLELETRSTMNLLDRQNAVYPEIVETVYRIRNTLRDAVAALAEHRETGWYTPELGTLALLLSERLYAYRAFIDEATFHHLHRVKRAAQDAYLEMNRLSRPEGLKAGRYPFGADMGAQEMQRRIAIAGPLLNEALRTIDEAYAQVVPLIRERMRGILEL